MCLDTVAASDVRCNNVEVAHCMWPVLCRCQRDMQTLDQLLNLTQSLLDIVVVEMRNKVKLSAFFNDDRKTICDFVSCCPY